VFLRQWLAVGDGGGGDYKRCQTCGIVPAMKTILCLFNRVACLVFALWRGYFVFKVQFNGCCAQCMQRSCAVAAAVLGDTGGSQQTSSRHG
jgi:hypothetical protein